MKQKDLEPIVQDALARYRALRDDDFQLWVYVSAQIKGTDIYKANLLEVMRYAKASGLPAFESVTRCRRKLQAQHPELCNEQTRKARANKEEEYREYSRS